MGQKNSTPTATAASKPELVSSADAEIIGDACLEHIRKFAASAIIAERIAHDEEFDIDEIIQQVEERFK